MLQINELQQLGFVTAGFEQVGSDGKSYLTFVLYYYLTFVRGLEADITGLDLKADVIEKCRLVSYQRGTPLLDDAVTLEKRQF